MTRTNTIVIGAGQAGLAVSHHLTEAGRDHVILERGQLVERWRHERWDSLRLLTPNWMTRLPGWSYQGDDPDGFMAAHELVDHLEGYARAIDAPVREQTTVESVAMADGGYRVVTDQGVWHARRVVIATGHCGHPIVPGAARHLSPVVHQLTSDRYRNPDQLPDGGVLVAGASATGVQLAEELARAGRDVVLAVGSHTRMPRHYRGADIFRWLEAAGTLGDHIDQHPDPAAARRSPSMQLVAGRNLDLDSCRRSGVRLAGRVVGADGSTVRFDDDLATHVARSDRRMHRTLDAIDRHVHRSGLAASVPPADRPTPIAVGPTPDHLHLGAHGIRSVLWATGFGRSYPWLHVPVVDRHGEIRHRNGITPAPGLYVVGLRYLRHRTSNFIGGVGRDARFVVDHLTHRNTDHQELAA